MRYESDTKMILFHTCAARVRKTDPRPFKPENATGMMRIKCGSASYTDVIALVGLKLFLSTPRGTDTYNFAGVTFKAARPAEGARNGARAPALWFEVAEVPLLLGARLPCS